MGRFARRESGGATLRVTSVVGSREIPRTNLASAIAAVEYGESSSSGKAKVSGMSGSRTPRLPNPHSPLPVFPGEASEL